MKNVLLVIMLLGSSACWASEQKVLLKAEERTKPLPVPPTKKLPMLPYPELEMYDVDASEAINFSELDTVELTVSGDFRRVVEDMAELSSTSFDSEEEFSQGLRDPSQLSLIINSLKEEERQEKEEPKGKSRSESATIRESQVKELEKELMVVLYRVSGKLSKLSKDDSWVELSRRPPEIQPRNRSRSFSSVPKHPQSTAEPEQVELTWRRTKTEVHKRPVRQGFLHSLRDKRKSPRGKIESSGSKSPRLQNSSSQESALPLNVSRKALSLLGPPEDGKKNKKPVRLPKSPRSRGSKQNAIRDSQESIKDRGSYDSANKTQRRSPRLGNQAVSAPTTPTLPREQLSPPKRSPMLKRRPTQPVAPTPPPRKSPKSKRLDKALQKRMPVGQDRPNKE